MSRYELLTWYPSLPRDWEVGMEVGIGDNKNYFSPCSSKYTDKSIAIYEVTKYPYFWEKISSDCTFDGVELYSGDEFFIVNLHTLSLSDKIVNIYNKTCDSERAKISGFLWFSTKEAAISYIAENKKTFTKANMLDFGKFVALKHLGVTYNIDGLYSEFCDGL